MSDYNIFIRGQSKVFLGGPPLVKMATGEDSTDEELGGGELHATKSGLADYLADSEHEAIRMARDVVRHLNWRKLGPGPSLPADDPVYDPDDLLGLVSKDLKTPFDVREVIARVVDGSRFEEFKPLYGPTLVSGWASVHGFPVGIIANNGVLFSDSSQKAAQFIQLCNQIDVPLLFLQNITGYIVGKDFEEGGIIKHGSQMINAVSNSKVPHITVILGASYGAGNYGMSGRAYDTRFVFVWPTAKIAVMGPKQMAGVMSIVRRGAAERRGETFDEEQDARIRAGVEAGAEAQSLGLYATGRLADDAMIDPRDTRHAVGHGVVGVPQQRGQGRAELRRLPHVTSRNVPPRSRVRTREHDEEVLMTEVRNWNAKILDEFRANEGRVGGPFEGALMLVLHTKGRKSGEPRENPMVYQDLGDGAVAVFASKGGAPTNPEWFHNALANVDVEVEFGSKRVHARARDAKGEERDRIWSEQKRRMPGFAGYETATAGIREIPVLILEPTT